MKKGDIVKGRITNIKPFGAFVKINETVDGMIHISEVSDRFVRSIDDYLSVGDIVDLEVIEISGNKKVSLSYRTQNINGRKKKEIINLTHGFKSLANKLDGWVEDYYKKRWFFYRFFFL